MRRFNHIGIPTTESKAGEVYNEGMKLYLTDYTNSANRIEWLRFDVDSWMPALIQNYAHIAYDVDDLEAEMAGKPVLLPITDLGGGVSIAFVEEEGIAVEFMYSKK